MTRAAAGQAARSRGAKWERDIRTHLEALESEGVILDWDQHGPLIERTGPGGHTIRIVEDTATVDFACWSEAASWKFEAKATGARRFALSNIKAHQARKLTNWHRPYLRRFGGIALRFCVPSQKEAGDIFIGTESTELWIPWDELAPKWNRWAQNKHAHGHASIPLHVAERMGIPWGKAVFG